MNVDGVRIVLLCEELLVSVVMSLYHRQTHTDLLSLAITFTTTYHSPSAVNAQQCSKSIDSITTRSQLD